MNFLILLLSLLILAVITAKIYVNNDGYYKCSKLTHYLGFILPISCILIIIFLLYNNGKIVYNNKTYLGLFAIFGLLNLFFFHFYVSFKHQKLN